MALDETAARDVTAVRAIETADRARSLWSDADRAWATHAALEVVGASAPPDVFVARRAGFALERLGERHPALARFLDTLTWRHWITPLVLIVAFLVGMGVDQIGTAGRVNILAPPVLGLLAWNLLVYLALVVGTIRAMLRPAGPNPHPMRRWVARLAGAAPRKSGVARDATLASALASFSGDWSRLAAPLYAVRAARILHLGAAALALGVIAGLYLRGIAFEYRASWQSTFLEAPQVHRILAVALAPGSAATGIPVPSVSEIAAIRSGSTSAGENAARWLHLFAATVGLVVIVPRLLLAMLDGAIARRRARRMPVALEEPYFRRLLRSLREGPARLRVLPYSFTPPAETVAGLHAILARAFGARSEIVVAAPVAYGAEDALPDGAVPADANAIVGLFNLTATPERENHGAFASTLLVAAGQGRDCIAVVDESSFRQRWPDEANRLAERRTVWRDLFTARRVPAVFVDLADPDMNAAEADLDAALEASTR